MKVNKPVLEPAEAMIDVLSSASRLSSVDDISAKPSEEAPGRTRPKSGQIRIMPAKIHSKLPENLRNQPKIDLSKFQGVQFSSQQPVKGKIFQESQTRRLLAKSYLGKRSAKVIPDAASTSTRQGAGGPIRTRTVSRAEFMRSGFNSSSNSRLEDLSDEESLALPKSKNGYPAVKQSQIVPEPQNAEALITKLDLHQGGNHHTEVADSLTVSERDGSHHRPVSRTQSNKIPNKDAETNLAYQSAEINLEEDLASLSSPCHINSLIPVDSSARNPVSTISKQSASTTQSDRRQGIPIDFFECFNTEILEAYSVSAIDSKYETEPLIYNYERRPSIEETGSPRTSSNLAFFHSQGAQQYKSSPPLNPPCSPKHRKNEDCDRRATGSRAIHLQQQRATKLLKQAVEDAQIKHDLHFFNKASSETSPFGEFGDNTELVHSVLREGPAHLLQEEETCRIHAAGLKVEIVYGLTVDEFFRQVCLPKPALPLQAFEMNGNAPLLVLQCNTVQDYICYQTKLAEYYGIQAKYMTVEELRKSVPAEKSRLSNFDQDVLKQSGSCKLVEACTEQILKNREKQGLLCIPEGVFNPEFFPEIETSYSFDLRQGLHAIVPKNTPSKGLLSVNTKPASCEEMVIGVEKFLVDILTNCVKEQSENFFGYRNKSQIKKIHPSLRASIVDMMISISRAKQLNDATLFLMINLFDKYCWKSPWACGEGRLTLTAWACYLIAAKVEEIYPMDFQELSAVWAPGLSNLDQLVAVEEDIIKTLCFRLSEANLYTYYTLVARLCRFSKLARIYGLYLAHVAAKYFEMNFYHPMVQALAILYLVCRILRGKWWNNDILKITNTTLFQVKCCAKSLLYFVHKDKMDTEQDEISLKFDNPWYMYVSKLDISKFTLEVF